MKKPNFYTIVILNSFEPLETNKEPTNREIKPGRWALITLPHAPAQAALCRLSPPPPQCLLPTVPACPREQRSQCGTVQLGIRDNKLFCYERQTKLFSPACDSTSLFAAAFGLFLGNLPPRPVRSLSVRACGLSLADEAPQLYFLDEETRRLKHTDLEQAMDKIRAKYGYASLRRGIQLVSPELDLDAKGDHIIHPVGLLMTLA